MRSAPPKMLYFGKEFFCIQACKDVNEVHSIGTSVENPDLKLIVGNDKTKFENMPNALGDCTLMQSTGLTDKNGKEIFEGDIVFFHETETRLGTVNTPIVFADGCFGLGNITTFPSIKKYCERYGEPPEIIGNIYENPDLLE